MKSYLHLLSVFEDMHTTYGKFVSYVLLVMWVKRDPAVAPLHMFFCFHLVDIPIRHKGSYFANLNIPVPDVFYFLRVP
jgi:hypothetical protein